MYLTKISGRSLKGGNFDFDLTRANVIVGDNFAGKTRIADAIRLLLIGNLPELGATPRATFELASGPAMEVFGTIDTGTATVEIRRRWFLKGDTVKMEVEVPEILADCPLLTVMLNAEEYFSLSDRARVDYVFANCPIEKAFTRDEITARIAKVAPGYEFAPFYEDVDAMEGVKMTPQLEIDTLCGFVAGEWKSFKEQAKRMEETVRGLTGLRAQDAQARPLAVIEDERARLERRVTELNEKRGVHATTYSAQKKAQVRRGEIAREINTTDKDAIEKVGLVEKFDMVLRELAAMGPEANVRFLFEDMVTKEGSYDRLRLPATDLRRQCENIGKEIAEIDGKETCPYCGAAGEGWKKIRLAELMMKADQLYEQALTAAKLRDAANDVFELATKTHNEAKQIEDRRARLKQEEGRCRDAISRLDVRLARRTALEEERDRLPAFDPLLEEQVEGIQQQLNVAAQEGRALENEMKDVIGRSHELTRLAKAESDRDKAKANQELAAAAGKELRVIQGELVEAAFKPLLDTANAIFAGVLPSALSYRDGMIGSWRSGVWVGHATFTGVEKALTYAAIQAALASRAPIRIMLLDELGRFTKKNAAIMSLAVLEAIKAGLIDQFVGIDPERPEIYSQNLVKSSDLAFKIIRIE